MTPVRMVCCNQERRAFAIWVNWTLTDLQSSIYRVISARNALHFEGSYSSFYSFEDICSSLHTQQVTDVCTRARTRRELNLLAWHNEARNHIHGRWDTKESYQEGLSLLRPPTHRHPHTDVHRWASMHAKDGKDALWVQISRVQPPRDHKEEGESWHEKVQKHIHKNMNPFFPPQNNNYSKSHKERGMKDGKKRKNTHTHPLCSTGWGHLY